MSISGVSKAASEVTAEGVFRVGSVMLGAGVGATAVASVALPVGAFTACMAMDGKGQFVKGAIPTILTVGSVSILSGAALGGLIGAYAPKVILGVTEMFLSTMK